MVVQTEEPVVEPEEDKIVSIMNKKIVFYSLCVALLLVLLSPNGKAQDNTQTVADSSMEMSHSEKKAERKKLNKEALKGKHFEITTMLTFASMNSGISITSPKGVLGVNLSLEKFLGFKKNVSIPSFTFDYSFTRRSSIYAEYYRIHRSVTYDVNDEFEFGNITVPSNVGDIKIYFDTDIWSIGYRYSLINSVKSDLSFFFNIYVLGVATGIDIDKTNVVENYSFTAPLPSFGYHFSHELFKNCSFNASMSFFILELQDFGGFINNTRLSIDYRVAKWIDLGVGYNYFNLRVNTTQPDFKTEIGYGYNGPSVLAQFNF